MRAPPPVEYRSALGPAWRAALGLVVATAVVAPGAWGFAWIFPERLVVPSLPWAFQALAWASFVVLFAWTFRRMAGARERTLRWDGQDWLLPGDGARPDQRGTVVLMLDLGPWLLVRFTPAEARAPACWLTFSLEGDGARWSVLRGALWTWCAGAPHRA